MGKETGFSSSNLLGWIEAFRIKVSGAFEGFPLYIIDILIYAPIGLLLGFLFRLFGRYFTIAIVVTVGFFWLGQYWQLITVNQEQVNSFLGMSPNYSLSDFGIWVQENVFATIILVVSFIFGWKLGG